MKASYLKWVFVGLLGLSPFHASAQQSAVGQNGRFQIVINPAARADTFLIDTQTGKVWQRTTFTNIKGDPEAWNYMERLDDYKQAIAFAIAHGVKELPASATTSP